MTITVPGPNPQVVRLHGEVGVYNQPSEGSIAAYIVELGAPLAHPSASWYFRFPYSTTNVNYGIPVWRDVAFIAHPGPHTYALYVSALGVAGELRMYNPTLIATTHPFGDAGAPSTLALDTDPDR